MGRKRVRIVSNFQPVKCAKRYLGSDDRISQLPDEILVDILSLLSLKEAARTSVLSSRWTNLWKHTTFLNLDGDHEMDKIRKHHKVQEKVIKSEGSKYVSWVDHVLQSHKALTLKEFRIRFALDRRDRKSITQWLEFAFVRQVQRLELDLQNYSDSSKFYRFPVELFDRSSGGAPSLPHPRNLADFKSLRALSFTRVKLTDGDIEFFLRNCPLLERLSVSSSTMMSNVEVCGSSLMLKHLEVAYCFGLESLKISLPSLTSLRVTRLEGLLLENVPMLIEIHANCMGDDLYFRKLFSAVSCCICQLEILCLELRESMRRSEPCKLPELPKLKKLVINYVGRSNKNLIGTTTLIKASPYLEEFILKCQRFKLLMEDGGVNDTINSPHEHLKVVMFSGYYGSASDLELVRYILENCIVLEKLIIDPSSSFCPGPHALVDPLDVERTARKTAKQNLEGHVPQRVELVVL